MPNFALSHRIRAQSKRVEEAYPMSQTRPIDEVLFAELTKLADNNPELLDELRSDEARLFLKELSKEEAVVFLQNLSELKKSEDNIVKKTINALTRAKQKLDFPLNVLLILLMALSKGGGAIFSIYNFLTYLDTLSEKDISHSDLGTMLTTIFGGLGFIATATVNLVGRGLPVLRSEEAKDSVSTVQRNLLQELSGRAKSKPDLSLPSDLRQPLLPSEDPDSNDEKKSEEKGLGESYKEKSKTKSSYPALIDVINGIYGYGIATNSIINGTALIGFLNTLNALAFDNNCKDAKNQPTTAVFINFFIFLLMYANLKVFSRYTVPADKEYYPKLFLEARLFTSEQTLFDSSAPVKLYDSTTLELPLTAKDGFLFNAQGEKIFSYPEKLFYKKDETDYAELTLRKGWQDTTPWERFKIFVSLVLNSFNTFYVSQKFNDLSEQWLFCGSMGKVLSTILSSLGTMASDGVSLVMTVGAAHNKKESARKRGEGDKDSSSTSSCLEKLKPDCSSYCDNDSEFGKWKYLLDSCTVITATVASLSGYLSAAAYLGDSPVAIAASVGAGLIGGGIQLLLDGDSLTRQDNFKREKRMIEEEKTDNAVSAASSHRFFPPKPPAVRASTASVLENEVGVSLERVKPKPRRQRRMAARQRHRDRQHHSSLSFSALDLPLVDLASSSRPRSSSR